MTTVSIDVFSVFPVSPLALSQMLKSAQATTGGGSKATMQTANGTGGVIVISGTGMQFDGTGHLASGVVTSMIIYSGDTVSTPITAKITGFSFNAASGFATPTPAPLYDGVNIDYDATTAIGSGAIFFAAGPSADTLLGSNGSDSLLGLGGSDNLQGRGGRDSLVGGTGNDKLDGGSDRDFLYGGTGNDTINGGIGNDWFGADQSQVASIGKVKIDLAHQLATGAYGTDTLTSIEYAMGGSGNDTLIGSSGANRLMGGIGSDSVSGGIGDDWITGNSGQDTLGGGQGKDWFVFTSSGASNADHVLDYSVADDTIILDHVAMKKLPFGPGTLASTYFRAGPVAKEADDFLIYDKATGKLFYDADGNGIAAPALIATFDNHPNITASEIMVKFSTSPEGFWYYVA